MLHMTATCDCYMLHVTAICFIWLLCVSYNCYVSYDYYMLYVTVICYIWLLCFIWLLYVSYDCYMPHITAIRQHEVKWLNLLLGDGHQQRPGRCMCVSEWPPWDKVWCRPLLRWPWGWIHPVCSWQPSLWGTLFVTELMSLDCITNSHE